MRSDLERWKLKLTLATFGLNKSFEAELSDMGVFDALKMLVDPSVPTYRESGALSRFEEVDCIVPTAEETAPMPSTDTGSSYVILDNYQSFQDRIVALTFG